MKKILSIDFDYFQKVSPEVLRTCYPDGVDLSPEISTIVWSGYYANPMQEEKLNGVSIMEQELKKIKEVILNQQSDIPAMIAGSHLQIYDFIHTFADTSDKLAVAHIDMHHDMFNKNPEVDCGNWLGHITEEYRTEILWIANPVTAEMYGLTDDAEPSGKAVCDLMKTSIAEIEGKTFDMIFLCRSDIWLPPHLDSYFSDLCKVMKQHFNEIILEQKIDKPREYQQYAEQMKKAYQKLEAMR